MKKDTKKTQKTDKGPWLLSEDSLKTIDSIMEKAYNNFIKLVETREDDYLNKFTNKKILTVWFNTDVKTEVDSFKEILVFEIYSKLKPLKFEYAIEVGHNRVNIELNGERYNSYFQYYVNCNDDNIENNYYLCFVAPVFATQSPYPGWNAVYSRNVRRHLSQQIG